MYRGFILNVPGPTLKERPRIPWKISTDGKNTLVSSEGNLDPYDGLVMFSKLINVNGAGSDDDEEDGICVEKGLEYCKRRVETKWRSFGSSDPLDLGMALWTSSWWDGEWAAHVRNESVKSVCELLHLPNLCFLSLELPYCVISRNTFYFATNEGFFL